MANQHELDFCELRGLEGELDLPEYFSHRQLAPGMPIRLLATDFKLTDESDAAWKRFERYADLATRLGVPYLRVFGGGPWGAAFSPRQWQCALQAVDRCQEELLRRGGSCEILLETHSSFSSSEMCLSLNEQLRSPLRLLWDSHHTWRNARESPEETWERIGTLVRHIHCSDSLALPDGKHMYVMPGEGEYPWSRLVLLLRSIAYRHTVSLEWEKLWHPGLPELEEALPAFLQLLWSGELEEVRL